MPTAQYKVAHNGNNIYLVRVNWVCMQEKAGNGRTGRTGLHLAAHLPFGNRTTFHWNRKKSTSKEILAFLISHYNKKVTNKAALDMLLEDGSSNLVILVFNEMYSGLVCCRYLLTPKPGIRWLHQFATCFQPAKTNKCGEKFHSRKRMERHSIICVGKYLWGGIALW